MADRPLTEKMRTVLKAMDKITTEARPKPPNQIAYEAYPGRKWALSHNGKRMGGGSQITFTLQALQRRGYIHWAFGRTDGLSGTAYYITPEGRAALSDL